MKRILRNKRGAILATAVMFMTVIAFMGILLTSLVMYSFTITRANDKIFQNRLTLDQIGEYFVAGTLTEAQLDEYGYVDSDTENDHILALKKKNGTTVVLYIEKEGTTAKVWR